MKCQILFSGKKKEENVTSVSSAEFVSIEWYRLRAQFFCVLM